MKNPSSMLPTRTTSQPVPKGNPTKFLVEPGPNLIIIKNLDPNNGSIQITQSAAPITFSISYTAFNPALPLTEFVSQLLVLTPDDGGYIYIENFPDNLNAIPVNVLTTNILC